MPREKSKKKGQPERPPQSGITTTHTEPPDTFNFLGLPPELRNIIYRMVFSSDENSILMVSRQVTTPSGFVSYPKEKALTALLATSKLIRQEAREFLFSSRIFYFPDSFVHGGEYFQPFFKQIGRLSARNLTHIIISMVGILMVSDPLADKDGRFTCSQRSFEMMQTIKGNCRRLEMFVVIVSCHLGVLGTPSSNNWLHLDLHDQPGLNNPRRAIPSLENRILVPSDACQGCLSPKIKSRAWASGWEVYDSYSQYVQIYQDVFPPGQKSPDTLERESFHHEEARRIVEE